MEPAWHCVAPHEIAQHKRYKWPRDAVAIFRAGEKVVNQKVQLHLAEGTAMANNTPVFVTEFRVMNEGRLTVSLDFPYPAAIYGTINIKDKPWFIFERPLKLPPTAQTLPLSIHLNLNNEMVGRFVTPMNGKVIS